MLAALRTKGITIEQRAWYAELAFDIIHHLYGLADFPHDLGVTKVWHKATSRATSFTTDVNWVRLLNTSICLCGFIFLGGASTCGDRFGTHPLENFIGLIRRVCNHAETLQHVLRAVAKATMVANFMNELGIPIKSRRRENCGGVSLASAFLDKLFKYTRLVPDPRKACDIWPFYPAEHSEILHLLELLHRANGDDPTFSNFDKNNRLRNKSSNESIVSRILHFSAKKEL